MGVTIRSQKKIAGGWKADLLVVAVDKTDLIESKPKRSSVQKSSQHAPSIKDVAQAAGNSIYKRIQRENFEATSNQAMLIHMADDFSSSAALLVTAPKSEQNKAETMSSYRKAGAIIADRARAASLESIAISNHKLNIKNEDNLAALLEGILLSGYSFDRYKSDKKTKHKKIKEVIILGENISEQLIAEVVAACEATLLARDLINIPPVDCAPRHLVEAAREIAKQGKLKIEVYDLKALTKLKAGGILAVAKGSDEEPYIIKLSYAPKVKAKKKIAIVGKGVTFDSGGLSIKTAGGMEAMKCDMSGAAAVLATMQALAVTKPKTQVVAYIPTTENMINGQATRPGDVITTLKGKTVEVLNTDAEGRLILADALAMAEADKADMIVDLATLTGACVVALGSDYAALYCSDEKLAQRLSQASAESGENLWRMPLAPSYREQIKSTVADIKNTGGKSGGGSITAALFLNEFVSATPWAHLDIAGTAFNEGGAKGHIPHGGVGFGVRTLLRFVEAL